MEKEKQIHEVINELQNCGMEIAVHVHSYDQLKPSLSEIINRLIINDFSRLISVLYRLDISEEKLKSLLSFSADVTAGNIIAEMIIERQLQKIESRKKFTSEDNLSDEERW